ncbi:MAG: hypothetical protein JEY96_09170 [Bacteroidales bacterium]|nr:hypothetical protein [Bacteroidales bacterium]
MKINLIVISLIISLLGFTHSSFGQNCHEFHKSKNCKVEDTDGFKLSSLSRSHNLLVGKTITYEVVMYGQKEMIVQCCTEDEYYPLRFKLISSINGDVIYDNKYDNYINSINLSLDRTELISIEITLVSTDKNKSIYEGTKACIGLAIYTEVAKVRQ